MSATFPTEVQFDANVQFEGTSPPGTRPGSSASNSRQIDDIKKVSSQDFRLPTSVNYIALRESLLSEAPFVSKSNKAFWRRMVDDYHYQNLLSAGFRHVLNCISDIGNVNVDKLLDMAESVFTRVMAVSVSEMIFSMKLRDRDVFFAKLPEITTFMIIEALHTSTPKHYRVYNSIRFREILLDWTNELLGGIRMTNCKAGGREWIFNSAMDSNIMVTAAAPSLPHILPNMAKTAPANLTFATTLYSVEHSPLVRMYMGMTDKQKPTAGGFGFKAALSHAPDRPLTVMNNYALLRPGKSYPRKVDMSAVRKTLKDAVNHRKAIMKEFSSTHDLAATESRRMRESLHTYLDHIGSKKVVSNKQLIAASQSSGGGTGGMQHSSSMGSAGGGGNG